MPVGLQKEPDGRTIIGLLACWHLAAPVAAQYSSAVDLHALFPSVEHGLVVLTPLTHDPFIPVLTRLEFDALPVHPLIVGIKSEIKPILIGQPIVVKIVSRCCIVRLVMGLEQRFVAHERVCCAAIWR